MAASMVLRLSSSCPPSTLLLFRSLPTKAFSLAMDSALLRLPTELNRSSTAIFLRRRSFSSAIEGRPRLLSFCSSSTQVGLEENDEKSPQQRWPEWDNFLEMLKNKGHYAEEAANSDFNRLKNACLSFARERFDLLRSLPVVDIQAIVEYGCPTVHRKPTNSGKRLRAFVLLNESDVCGSCSLRGACDRANAKLNNEEGARTVDVIRIILYYAVDPNLLLRFDASQRRSIEGSIRALLSKLTELSDTPVDTSLLEEVKAAPPQDQPQKSKINSKSTLRSGSRGRSLDVEMKRGDWVCSKCNFLNFSRNLKCMECGFDGPKKVDSSEVEMKKGDWTCPECQFMNFSRNRECRRCQHERPPRELNPGEWECPSCDFLNYRRNMTCLKCRHERPEELQTAESDSTGQHTWKRPALR
ncbi:uncharacterized protein LOC144711017 [Wolffia australiana]